MPPLLETRFCDLGLSLAGSRLEPLLQAFDAEVAQVGLQVRAHYYLSTEWGVPFDTISLAIPFYLARKDLIALHAEQVGFLEGSGRGDFLRYMRHEMGHVVNYAYRLYERADWTDCYGPMDAEYDEVYRPQAFSPKHVCHLPGWYAQKHPDEDWAESFAVWMTPGYDWRSAYASWPAALAKLEFCDRLLREVNARPPEVTATDADEDVTTMADTLREFYAVDEPDPGMAFSPALDAQIHGIFEDLGDREQPTDAPRRDAATLIRRLELDLAANAFRWTGCFPERVRPLVRQLADRAEQLRQVYPADAEMSVVAALTSLVTALATDDVLRGE